MPKHGESIWKRKDGRWEGRYIKDRTPEGKAIYCSVYGKSYSEVKKKRNDLINKQKEKKDDNNIEISFEHIISGFLNEHKFIVKESTYARYVEIARTHLYPDLGIKNIKSFCQNDANEYIIYLLSYGKYDGTGLAAKTVKDIISLLKLVLKFAVKKKYITNNSISLTVPKQIKPEIQVLSPTQRENLERFVQIGNDTYKFGVYLCLYTGMRIGEICALQWKDIDLENSTISINKTVLRIKDFAPNAKSKTKLIISTPKTPSSKRIIPMPSVLTTMLMNLQTKETKDNDFLLTGTEKFIEPRNYYERYKGYLNKCDLKGFNFHVLRHTFATRCIERGVDAKVLSEILGHSSVKITLDLYVHPSLDTKRTSLEKLFTAN